jgi:hypothetical protein
LIKKICPSAVPSSSQLHNLLLMRPFLSEQAGLAITLWTFLDDDDLQPPMGLFFMPQVVYEHGKPQWNDVEEENP